MKNHFQHLAQFSFPCPLRSESIVDQSVFHQSGEDKTNADSLQKSKICKKLTFLNWINTKCKKIHDCKTVGQSQISIRTLYKFIVFFWAESVWASGSSKYQEIVNKKWREKRWGGRGNTKEPDYFLSPAKNLLPLCFLSPAKHLLPLCRPPGAGKCLWMMSEQWTVNCE